MIKYAAIIIAFLVNFDIASAESNADRITCLPLDKQGCGCSLAIKQHECSDDRSQYQFFSELFDGAPLWMAINNRVIELTPGVRIVVA